MLKSSAQPETSLVTASALRLLAICGIVSPIFFAIVVIVLASIEPGYSHLSQPISMLGRVGGPHAVIQNFNFALTGLLFLAFAVGLHLGISGGKGSKVGPLLVAVGGLGFVFGAIFQCPATSCAPFTPLGAVHDMFGLSAFVAFCGAAISLSRRLKSDSRWHDYATYSFVSGLVNSAFFVVYMVSNASVPNYTGLTQRLVVGTFLVWTVVMAVRLFQIAGRPQARVAAH